MRVRKGKWVPRYFRYLPGQSRILAAVCLAVAPFALAAGWSVGYALDTPPAERVPAVAQEADPLVVPPVPRHLPARTEEQAAPDTVVQVVEQAPPSTPSVPSATPTITPTTEAVVVEDLVLEEDVDEVVEEDQVDTDIPVLEAELEAPYGCTEPDAEGLRACGPGLGAEQ